MKKGYRIGLFFICLIIAVLIVVLMWKRHTISSFPEESADNGIENNNVNENIVSAPDSKKDSPQTVYIEELPVQMVGMVTTCDTVCIYENIDKKDGAISMEEGKLPAKYIGMSRAELEDALSQDSLAPTLEDKEKGFKSQHLELFSADKVKILRIYDTTTEIVGFYIMEINGEVGVFKEDKKTLYFKTGLKVKDLPADVMKEVRDGKFMDTEIQVYHFLESYSS